MAGVDEAHAESVQRHFLPAVRLHQCPGNRTQQEPTEASASSPDQRALSRCYLECFNAEITGPEPHGADPRTDYKPEQSALAGVGLLAAVHVDSSQGGAGKMPRLVVGLHHEGIGVHVAERTADWR